MAKSRKRIKNLRFTVSSLLSLWLLSACTGLPEGIKAVDNFDINRFQGTWYEIARLDHSFERGLEQVSANYSLRDDGGIRVINRGFNVQKQQWKEAEGRAYAIADENIGHLKVSFFGPFYSSYVVFELAQQSNTSEAPDYAFVTSYSKDYLWLLSRTPTITPELKAHFLTKIKDLGFAADNLIWVKQNVDIK